MVERCFAFKEETFCFNILLAIISTLFIQSTCIMTAIFKLFLNYYYTVDINLDRFLLGFEMIIIR